MSGEHYEYDYGQVPQPPEYTPDVPPVMRPEVDMLTDAHRAGNRAGIEAVMRLRALKAAQQEPGSELVLRHQMQALDVRPRQQGSHGTRNKLLGGILALGLVAAGGALWYRNNETPVTVTVAATEDIPDGIMDSMAEVDAAGMDALGPQSCKEPGAEIATLVLESVRVPLIYELELTKEQNGSKKTYPQPYVSDTKSEYPEVELRNVVVGITACDQVDTPAFAVEQDGDRVKANVSDIAFQAKLHAYGFTNSVGNTGDESVVVYPAFESGGAGLTKNSKLVTDESVDAANKIHGTLVFADSEKDIEEQVPDQLYGAVNEAVDTVVDAMLDVNQDNELLENVRLPEGANSAPEALRAALAARVSAGEVKPQDVDVNGIISEIDTVLDDKELRGLASVPEIAPVQIDAAALVLGAYVTEQS